MRKLIGLALIGFAINVSAQEAQPDTSPKPAYGWKKNLVGGLNLTQVSFNDWQQGGEDALAWTLTLDGKFENDQPKTNWATSYKFAFGQTKLGEQGIRKTDDKIDLETVLTYKLGSYVNPYFAATLKTQFARGFQYAADGTKTQVSKFFDPGYLTQSAGFGYQPAPQVKTRLGVALREIITSDFAIYSDDPATDEIEKTKVQGGMESVTNVDWKLAANLLLTAKLELFAPFETFDEAIVRSDNTLAAKVSKYVTVNLNVQLINERKVTPRTQVKETIAIGLSYALL
jgi:hypothetical protein